MKQTHVVLDLEMHPISAYTYPTEHSISPNEIIQLGMVILDENMTQITTYSTYIKPKYAPTVTRRITKLTGITTSDLENSPSLEDVLIEISRMLENHSNVRFYTWSDTDRLQLMRETKLKGLELPSVVRENRFLDLQRIYTRLLHYPHSLSLKDAACFTDLNFDAKKLHSATFDAMVTVDLLKLVKSKEQFAVRTKNVRQTFDASFAKTTLGDIFGKSLDYIHYRVVTL